MVDLRTTVIPKSDQLNADDLIGRSLTIEITEVRGVDGDQPIAIYFKGDNGKPFKPCKCMRRVLIQIWGPDSKNYIGRSMTLYRDETVKFGGIAVGGIRISHMSHIKEDITLALTTAKAQRKPYVVKPLQVQQQAAQAAAPDPATVKAGDEAAAKGKDAYAAWLAGLTPEVKETIRHLHNGWAAKAKEITAAATPQVDDPAPPQQTVDDFPVV